MIMRIHGVGRDFTLPEFADPKDVDDEAAEPDSAVPLRDDDLGVSFKMEINPAVGPHRRNDTVCR